jgi:alanine racemase
MQDSSIITLKREAIQHNIRFIRRELGRKVRISSIVKANAYGHGIEQFIPELEKEGIDHFSVFEFSEAIQVASSISGKQDIMIMGYISDENLKETIQRGFEFYVFTSERLKKALQTAKEQNKKAKIHLEVETGMNRSGLNQRDLKKAIVLIGENKEHFILKGFCTHLAGPESISNHLRIQKQLERYEKMLQLLNDHNLKSQYRHVANSAAAIVYPETRLDMVRVGIMQYGFWPSIETFIHYIRNKREKDDPLIRVLGWKSEIMALKTIQVGEFVGYGISYLAQKKMRTALIPIGYSLGYNRSLSNKGRVIINGQRCGVIGVVNMNMIVADVTDLPKVKIGDEAVVIGQQGDIEIKVSAFSSISNELNYEVLTHLAKSIERTII